MESNGVSLISEELAPHNQILTIYMKYSNGEGIAWSHNCKITADIPEKALLKIVERSSHLLARQLLETANEGA